MVPNYSHNPCLALNLFLCKMFHLKREVFTTTKSIFLETADKTKHRKKGSNDLKNTSRRVSVSIMNYLLNNVSYSKRGHENSSTKLQTKQTIQEKCKLQPTIIIINWI